MVAQTHSMRRKIYRTIINSFIYPCWCCGIWFDNNILCLFLQFQPYNSQKIALRICLIILRKLKLESAHFLVFPRTLLTRCNYIYNLTLKLIVYGRNKHGLCDRFHIKLNFDYIFFSKLCLLDDLSCIITH